MLKYDLESKGGSEIPQGDQDHAELYLPSESELQMAQVGFVCSVQQISVLIHL